MIIPAAVQRWRIDRTTPRLPCTSARGASSTAFTVTSTAHATSRTRVARLHLQLAGEPPADLELELHAAASGDGVVIPLGLMLEDEGRGG